MVISKYLDSIEGTEHEPTLQEGLVKLLENEDVAQLLDKPAIGKIFRALAALASAESIAEFRGTEYYDNIKDWGITVLDLEKGHISIHPGPKHMKKFFAVIAIVGCGLMLFKLYRKYRLGIKA